MSKVLITGGAGYIGTHICVLMAELGFQILVIDNFTNSVPKIFKNLTKIVQKPIRLSKVDLCNKEALEKAFHEFKPEFVIHLAGLKSVKESIEHPLKYYRNNILSTTNLLEVMSSVGCSNIVFSSSATVYGLPKILPIPESHSVVPVNPYGHSKLFIEQIISDWRLADPNRHAICLRYFNPIGAHPSGSIGELPLTAPTNIFPIISRVASSEHNYFSVFGNDYDTRDGTAERDYIHVMDLAEAHVMAISELTSYSFEVINVGTGVGITVQELVESFENVVGREIECVPSARRIGDVDRCFADARKAYQLLNWKAKRSLSKACEDQWRWERSCIALNLYDHQLTTD